MKAIAVPVEELRPDWAKLPGSVSATNVPDFARGTGFLFRKGDILGNSDGSSLSARLESLIAHAPAGYSLHLLQMEADEISEDEAGLRLAGLVAGPGVELQGPVESRVNLVAKGRGLLRVDQARLDRLNEVPGVAVFTLYDGMAVNAGTEVAGAKVIPLVYPSTRLDEVAEIVAQKPVVDVVPFRPLRVAVLVREHLKPGPRARFSGAVSHKLAWFGAELLDIAVVDSAEAIAARLSDFKARGAELILHVGGHSSDPLDLIFPALHSLGVEMERHGAPAHPGTLFWLAYWGETALFGLASCGMFSKTTLGDLFLARLMAGEHLTAQTIARIGYGGFFTREMAFRFPPYGLETHD